MNFILPKRARAPSRRSGTKLENTSLSTDVVQGFCSDKIHAGLLLSFKKREVLACGQGLLRCLNSCTQSLTDMLPRSQILLRTIHGYLW